VLFSRFEETTMRNLLIGLVIAVSALGSTASFAAARHGAADPEVHVSVATPGTDGAKQAHVDTIRRVLLEAFKCAAASRGEFTFDVSVAKLAVATVRGHVQVTAELHAVISDRRGNILSSVSGCATVEAPLRALDSAGKLDKLQRDAIEEAAGGLVHPLDVQLARTASRRAEPVLVAND
jgi:hypothetical protein